MHVGLLASTQRHTQHTWVPELSAGVSGPSPQRWSFLRTVPRHVQSPSGGQIGWHQQAGWGAALVNSPWLVLFRDTPGLHRQQGTLMETPTSLEMATYPGMDMAVEVI